MDETVQFHVLPFEGPGRYAQAGGISSRVPAANAALRSSARLTAEQYAWPEIIERTLLPRVSLIDQ